MGKRLGFVHQDLERYHGFVSKGHCAHTNDGDWWKTTVKTSATTDIGRLTKSLKKMKMNNLTIRQFSVSKCGDAF